MEDSVATGTNERYSKRQIVLIAGVLTAITLLLGTIVNYAYSPYGLHRAPSGVEYLGSGIAYYALMLGVVAGFLRVSGRGRQYLDVQRPRRRTWLWVVGGVIGMFVVMILFGTLTTILGLPVAEANVNTPLLEGTIKGDLAPSTITLVMLLLLVVIIPPVEELLHRNVIQKLLVERFSPVVAIGGASLLFTLGHVPSYYSPSLLATGVALLFVFLGGIVFGVVYHVTENLVAATIVHSFINLLGFLPVYLESVPVEEVPLVVG